MKRFVCASLFSVLAIPVGAQNTDIEALAGLTFNFRNPGARSLAMGGAFLGLADDATAAEANPAGLTILRLPEVSLELRNHRTDTVVNATGDYPDLETDLFITHSQRAEISFASVVFPGERWALALYYHLPLRLETEINQVWEFDDFNQPVLRSLPIFFVERGDPPGSGGAVTRQRCIELQTEELGSCTGFQINPYLSAVEVEQETWGAAGAVELGRLSLGAGVRRQTFRQAALTLRYTPDLVPVEALIQATELDDEFEPQEVDDTTFTAGFKWTLSNALSIGGVFKQGAEYPTGVFQRFVAEGEVFDEAFPTTFHVPDTAGIGFAWRPAPVLTFVFDGVWVKYSNLTDDFRSAYPEIAILDQPYEVEDSWEYHAGIEYFFTTRIPVAIRAGYWLEPAHGLRYAGPQTCTDPEIAEGDRVLCAANRVRSGIIFPGGRDQDHYSVGIGLAWPSFQIDAAYDTSDDFKVGSLSAVFRF
ncbi:MAG TPA: hypothetical protein VMS56_11905 [Thermoanaerobaculia bacterium]|nr:hypothetical protein [Thermoanaerobaculia bacterium]